LRDHIFRKGRINLKKRAITVLLFLFVTAVSFSGTGLIYGITAEKEAAYYSADTVQEKPKAENVVTENEEGFVVKTYYGNIGVFSLGEKAPLYITDIETSSLRDVDKQELQRGISIKTYEEVLRLLEDFNS